ncbi:MAG: transposase [bacterium]
MGKSYRKYEIGFKRQVVQEIEAGLFSRTEAARKYDISANLIDRWLAKYRNGTLVERPTTTELKLRAENERLKIKVAEQALENDLLKKLMDCERRRRKEGSSVVTGRSLVVCAGGAK